MADLTINDVHSAITEALGDYVPKSQLNDYILKSQIENDYVPKAQLPTEMTVSDSGGTGKIGTVSLKATDKFTFYAKATGGSTHEVKLVMPLGGPESGLFRYPKIGEKVLVSQSATGVYYLIGYVPSAADQDFTTDEAQTERGEIFRYRQSGLTEAGLGSEAGKEKSYSEIGFYHTKTAWKAGANTQDNYVDNGVEHIDYPNIDRLNIQSTGDIHSRAVNHHRMQAKRFELLVDCNETDFSKDLTGSNRPYGDAGSDESSLFSGDAHIRAKRRIIIKAGKEIRLEVGRSTIIISDSGIMITSRKTHADIPNTMDSMLSILPRDGITMSGQHLRVIAVYDWSIIERMGASIKGTAGILRITGKDIKLSTVTGVGYIVNFIAQTAALAANLTSMSIGTHDSDDVQSSAMPSNIGMGVTVAGMLANVGIGLGWSGNINDDDTDSLLFTITTLILQMIPIVLTAIETIYIDPEDRTSKDALAIAGVVAEWGCLIPILSYLCYDSLGPYMVFNAWQHFANNGEMYMGGAGIKAFTQDQEIVNAPAAGFETPEEDDRKWYQQLLDFAKKNWWKIGLGLLAGGGAVVGGLFTLGRMDNLETDKADLLKQLNEL